MQDIYQRLFSLILGRLGYPTLQCSHLFFTELCTFIPLTCSNAPPATKLSLFGATAGAVLAARPSAGLATARVVDTERAPKARSSEALISSRFEGRLDLRIVAGVRAGGCCVGRLACCESRKFTDEFCEAPM